ncbi:zinc finger and SCAN domain-containing protein 29-like [Mauremys reevesii]|uniref:zinc finger and SCAN domain-containing protein 29-like n=1 Tax=Mauremys reevesii TaxID=260615 RepID=UPI00193FE18A|nr:zinc finger and SCAN domain-containing protein 29-like [Mauremys reevesii]
MAAQVRKRAPAFSTQETLDLIAMWGEEHGEADIFAKIARRMGEKGYTRDAQQCRVKIRALRQAYQKTRMANSRPGAEPQTCRFYEQLHAILDRDSISFPILVVDSSCGVTYVECFVDEDSLDEEEEEEENVQQSSGGSTPPKNQDLFLTLEPIPSQDPLVQDCDGGEGTSAAALSLAGASSTPAQRLSQIRRQKKRTREAPGFLPPKAKKKLTLPPAPPYASSVECMEAYRVREHESMQGTSV